jgi:hypothetical protein
MMWFELIYATNINLDEVHLNQEGTTTGKQEGTQSMQCNNMMHDHDMAI